MRQEYKIDTTNKIIWFVGLSRSAIPLTEIVQCHTTTKHNKELTTQMNRDMPIM